ncbi:hypothetical protein [Jiangella alba]|uniref:Uncharacterized protein n=1 Tax=Jiangella alba TaxID=561176 RepID=A0A1H5MPC1_9ACTN|nr:hypothetical protein [Jiangella alba]SEE91073.1 hypothetical protein SAMN04488561_3311 [Jiangella alba]
MSRPPDDEVREHVVTSLQEALHGHYSDETAAEILHNSTPEERAEVARREAALAQLTAYRAHHLGAALRLLGPHWDARGQTLEGVLKTCPPAVAAEAVEHLRAADMLEDGWDTREP